MRAAVDTNQGLLIVQADAAGFARLAGCLTALDSEVALDGGAIDAESRPVSVLQIRIEPGPVVIHARGPSPTLVGSPEALAALGEDVLAFVESSDINQPGAHCHFEPEWTPSGRSYLDPASAALLLIGTIPDVFVGSRDQSLGDAVAERPMRVVDSNGASSWELRSTNGYSRLSCRPQDPPDAGLSVVTLEYRPAAISSRAERTEFSGIPIDAAALAELRLAVQDLLAGPFEASWFRSWEHHAELADAASGWSLSVTFGGAADDLILGPASIACRVAVSGDRLSARQAFVTDPTCLGLFVDRPPQDGPEDR